MSSGEPPEENSFGAREVITAWLLVLIVIFNRLLMRLLGIVLVADNEIGIVPLAGEIKGW